MKKTSLVLLLFLLCGCATPVTVKQAVKKQSEAYSELQTAIQEFTKRYEYLNESLFQLNQEAQLRIESLALVNALCGKERDSLTQNLLKDTWAVANFQQVNELARKLDSIPANRTDILNAFDKTGKYIDESIENGNIESENSIEKIRETLKAVENSQLNALKELRALSIIHDTVGEYLEIDLAPDSKSLKELITNINTLK